MQSRGQRDLTCPAADAVATVWRGHARAVALDLGLAGVQVVEASWAELQVVRGVRVGTWRGCPSRTMALPASLCAMVAASGVRVREVWPSGWIGHAHSEETAGCVRVFTYWGALAAGGAACYPVPVWAHFWREESAFARS